jgi:hypothetical protein
MSALRAFRKQEISVFRQDLEVASSIEGGGNVGLAAVQDALLPLASSTQVKLHSSDEREPLPLALHHTPLSVTFGVFDGIVTGTEVSLISQSITNHCVHLHHISFP